MAVGVGVGLGVVVGVGAGVGVGSKQIATSTRSRSMGTVMVAEVRDVPWGTLPSQVPKAVEHWAVSTTSPPAGYLPSSLVGRTVTVPRFAASTSVSSLYLATGSGVGVNFGVGTGIGIAVDRGVGDGAGAGVAVGAVVALGMVVGGSGVSVLLGTDTGILSVKVNRLRLFTLSTGGGCGEVHCCRQFFPAAAALIVVDYQVRFPAFRRGDYLAG